MGILDDAKEVVVAERRRKVWELKVKGMSANQIALEVGVRPFLVRQDIARTTRMMDVTRWLETEMALDLDRLNQLLMVWLPKALGDADKGIEPNEGAFQGVIKVMERRAKLLGLDAPKRVDYRMIIAEFAEREGLDYEDVVDAVGTLIPELATTTRG